MRGAGALIGLLAPWNLFPCNNGSDPNLDDSNERRSLAPHLLSLTPAVYISNARTASFFPLPLPPSPLSEPCLLQSIQRRKPPLRRRTTLGCMLRTPYRIILSSVSSSVAILPSFPLPQDTNNRWLFSSIFIARHIAMISIGGVIGTGRCCSVNIFLFMQQASPCSTLQICHERSDSRC